jgi:hypothetical protein
MVNGVTDNQTNTWSLAKAAQYNFGANCAAGNCLDSEIWYTQSTSAAGHDSVIATFSTTPTGTMEMIDVTGLTPNVAATTSSTCASPCAGPLTTATSLAQTQTTDFVISSAFTSCQASGILTPGTNYTPTTPPNTFDGAIEYSNSSSGFVPTPTNFSWSCSVNFGNAIDVGVVFGPLVSITNLTTKVVACTWFELQCWWYPMLFFGVYGGTFILTGGAGKVSSRGVTYLMLSALTFGGLAMVMMDMMNVMIPLILAALTALYAVRTR